MNLRTSHLTGIIASALVILTTASGLLSAAEPLKITGPDGEQRQVIRQYGPTTSADTFWSIAQKTRPDDSVTVYQVMAAIYEANPHAFANNNYNSLEKGMILLIPSKAVMAAIPKSLAKQLAQTNDAGWQQSKSQATKAQSMPPRPTATQPPTVVAAKPVSQPDSTPTSVAETVKPAAQVDQITKGSADVVQQAPLNAKLEAQQAKNLSLTDELARAEDKLNLAANDNQLLQDRIAQLETRVAELEEALLIQKEQKAELSNQVTQLNQELTAAELSEPVAETGDSWRTIMSNPLYIGLVAAIPALLLLLLIAALVLKRRNASDANTPAGEEASPQNAAEIAATQRIAPSDEAEDESDAVHLDDEVDTLESLMSVDNDGLQPENDFSDDSENLDMAPEMFIDTDSSPSEPQEDEGQSLDDLWAEAMGEQEEETYNGVIEQDDLDSLLADMDSTEPVANETESTTDIASSTDTEADLDALLAEFDASEISEAQDDNEDLSQQIAQELEQDAEDDSFEEADLDSLLAEFDAPVDPKTEEALIEEVNFNSVEQDDTVIQEAREAGRDEAKTAEMAAQALAAATLASDSLIEEVAFEAEQQVDADKQETADSDEANAAALVAEELANDSLIEDVAFEADEQDIAEQIAAELAEDDLSDTQEEDLDALLAGFGRAANSDNDAADDVEADANDTNAPLKRGSTAAPLEFESFAIEQTPTHSADEDADIALDLPSDDVSLDDLLADLESVDNKESQVKNEQGFFDDLKGNKRSAGNILEWDNATEQQEVDAQADNEAADKPDDELSLTLEDDDNLTVDEALAALDAQERQRKPAQAVAEHDLTAFQQDNGFIDIDRLLNEADEEHSEIDQYKELNVDMGELDDLMGTTTMVDVDDEENSVNAKLDLARAYIEIDDMDSAKALLKEVQLDGNERQQSEAKHLLSDL